MIEKLVYEAGFINHKHIYVGLQAPNGDGVFWFEFDANSEMGVADFIAHLFLSAYILVCM